MKLSPSSHPMTSWATWAVYVACHNHQPTTPSANISATSIPLFLSLFSLHMSASRLLIRAALVAVVASSVPVHAFYLPGAAPHDYQVAENVDLFVNALTPMLSGSDDAKLVSTCSVPQTAVASSCVNIAEVANQLYVTINPFEGLSDVEVLDDYYHPSFHFCEPEGGPHKQPESLGSILFGDRIFDSPYDVGACRALVSSLICSSRFECWRIMGRANRSAYLPSLPTTPSLSMTAYERTTR
jgi:Endomembrane protein 70